jgi:hypothetical protein
VVDLFSVLHTPEALAHLFQAGIITNTNLVEDSTVSLVPMAVEVLHQEEVELSEDNLEPAATLLVKQVDSIKDMGLVEVVSVVLKDSAEVLVVSTMGLPVVLIKEVVAALEVRQEEVSPVLLVTRAVSPVVYSEVSIHLEATLRPQVMLQVNREVRQEVLVQVEPILKQLVMLQVSLAAVYSEVSTQVEVILRLEVILQVNQEVRQEVLVQVEPILKQLVMLQVSLLVENLEVVFRADSEVLVMTPLLFKSLGVAVAGALIVIPTVSLDLQIMEGSVALQVSQTANLHPLLVLVALAGHPVDRAVMLHHLLVHLVLVAVAVLRASRLQVRIVDQEVPDRPASLVHHPTVMQ